MRDLECECPECGGGVSLPAPAESWPRRPLRYAQACGRCGELVDADAGIGESPSSLGDGADDLGRLADDGCPHGGDDD